MRKYLALCGRGDVRCEGCSNRYRVWWRRLYFEILLFCEEKVYWRLQRKLKEVFF
ncbi:MAG: hypothetical protein PHW73_08910 [Atribacterota bacterium]|jgi:hypothetical protein|nr:hypothetical protein [Atribacterota bacterium]